MEKLSVQTDLVRDISNRKTINFSRCQNVKAKSIKFHDQNWYDDLQTDYRKYLKLFFSWMAIGYENETGVVITPEQSKENRDKNLSENQIRLLEKFISVLLKGGVASSSCYNVFYSKYRSNGAKRTKTRNDFFESLDSLSEESYKKTIKKDPQLGNLSFEEWNGLLHKVDKNNIWNEVSGRLVDLERQVGSEVRKVFNVTCKRPDDYTYCNILIEMVGRQLRSVKEKYNFHLNEKNELKKTIQEKTNDLFLCICKLSDSLNEKNSGLSKYVLIQGVEQVIKPPKVSNIATALDVMTGPEFKKIIDASKKDRMEAYNTWKLKCKFDNKKDYPRFSDKVNDYKVPVGLTSLGDFELTVKNNCINVKVDGFAEFSCYYSYYFHDVKIEKLLEIELRDGKKIKKIKVLQRNDDHVFVDGKWVEAKVGNVIESDNSNHVKISKISKVGYNIKFCHKVKSKKINKVGHTIEGVVKEIGISKRNGQFYISLLYTITHAVDNFKLKTFFQSANAKESPKQEEIKVCGIDLNISNVICTTKANIKKNGTGPINALDYGAGEIVQQPTVVQKDGERCPLLIKIKNDAQKVVQCIREYKECKKSGRSVSVETKEWLGKIELKTKQLSPKNVKEEISSVRFYIQTWVKFLKDKLKKTNYKMRLEGYQNLSELIRLLDAKDKCQSMTNSYDRIHLNPGEQLPLSKKFDSRRSNFRLFVSRRIAASCVESARDCNVVFFEDLNSKFDSDNDNNSLGRLFSANTLLKCIEEAFQKAGIGYVEVDKRGTSKGDPITGLVGVRGRLLGNKSFVDKEKLYVVRDGKLVWINSDLAASLNVLLLGVNHSVVPYKFYHVDPSLEDVKKGERIKRFLREKFGTENPHFTLDGNGNICQTKKVDDKTINKLYIYYQKGKLLTAEQHYTQQQAIKDMAANDKNIKEDSVTGCIATTYDNFSFR